MQRSASGGDQDADPEQPDAHEDRGSNEQGFQIAFSNAGDGEMAFTLPRLPTRKPSPDLQQQVLLRAIPATMSAPGRN